jgi:NAD(P)H-nitrite reductase large subunit
VIADDGTEESYDRLLLATGSNPFVLPIPGKDLPGVITYRDIHDTKAMIDAASKYRRAVVIGGGLLGLEAANGLMLRGMDVTVVHLAEWLMERQLDKTAADMLKKIPGKQRVEVFARDSDYGDPGECRRTRRQHQFFQWRSNTCRSGGDGRRHQTQ